MVMTLPKSNKVTLQANREATDFEVLFQEHWNRLCGVLFRLVGDWDEAQDLALDTYEQLYRRPPKDDTNLSGWLYRVATNRGLNALRARGRRARYEQKAGTFDVSISCECCPGSIGIRGRDSTSSSAAGRLCLERC